MKKIIMVLALVAALVLTATAGAWENDPPKPPPKKHHHHHHHHGAPTPTPDPTPTPAAQDTRQAFCVTSVEGKTYLDLTVGALNAGTVWRAHYDNGDTVVVGGRSIKLVNTGPGGITPAINNGSTC